MENMNSLKIGKVDFIESELFYEEKKSKKTQNDDKTWKVVKILFFILVFIIFLEFIIYKLYINKILTYYIKTVVKSQFM